jgi:predicted nucleic-acid-binding protein
MAAVDTNVLVRLLTADDPAQTARAEALLALGPVWVSTVVLVEAVWVLSAVYGWNKAQLLAMLLTLTDSRDFTVQEPLVVAAAVASYSRHTADFADCLALELARAYDQLPFATFDARAAKLPGAVRP